MRYTYILDKISKTKGHGYPSLHRRITESFEDHLEIRKQSVHNFETIVSQPLAHFELSDTVKFLQQNSVTLP